MEYFENKIRKVMRSFPIECQSCGGDNVTREKEQDTELGIMDECYCYDCETSFYMISSVNTMFVPTKFINSVNKRVDN